MDFMVAYPHSFGRLPLQWKCWFLRRRVNRNTRRKTSPIKRENQMTTNSTHIWRRHRDLNPDHIGGRQELSTMHHPCCLNVNCK